MIAKSLLQHSRMLTLQARAASTINSRVLQSSIFLPEMYPAKLTVPLQSGNFEFTVHNKDSVADFCKKVKASCGSDLKEFSLSADRDASTLGELKRGTFQMSVNGKSYEVYPDLRSLIFDSSKVQNRDACVDLNE